jgi:hypothetical protein
VYNCPLRMYYVDTSACEYIKSYKLPEPLLPVPLALSMQPPKMLPEAREKSVYGYVRLVCT